MDSSLSVREHAGRTTSGTSSRSIAAVIFPPAPSISREVEWRDVIHCGVPVVPWHERRKYLDRGDRFLWKWAGLGHYGRSRMERAEELSRAGFIPQPRSIADGFLLSSWMEGEAACLRQ